MIVPQLVSTDAGRQPFLINQRGYRLAEAMRRHAGHTKLVADSAPLLAEVVRVAQRARR